MHGTETAPKPTVDLPAGNAQASASGIVIDLGELFYQLLEKIWLLALAGVLGALLMGVYSFSLSTPQYQSTAVLYVLSPGDSIVNMSDLQIGSSLTSDYMAMVGMREVNAQVIENLGLPYTIPKLRQMLTTSNPQNTRLLLLTVRAEDPYQAAQIANEFAQVAQSFIVEKMHTEMPTLVSSAVPEYTAVSPNHANDVISGALAGLMLCAAIIVLRTLLDDKIKSPEDVTRYGQLPMLAVMPLQTIGSEARSIGLQMDKLRRNNAPLGMLTIGRLKPLDYACTEAMNTLATSLTFAGNGAHTFLLTSCQASEGKTFISLYLMYTLTRLGKRVVLVDTDMRNSSLVSRYAIQMDTQTRGLSHYLAGLREMHDILHATNIPGAHLVLAGAHVANPLSLLSSPRFGALLEELEQHFDVVLVDTPPVGLVVDAVQIARSCDRILFVVGDQTVTRRELMDATTKMRGADCLIYGAVLNKVRFDAHRSKRYYHQGYYSHYHGSHYGAKEATPNKKTAKKARNKATH
ncbi:MAG: polysaccharide biosynthesis tyrosine autokinase [Oscillospiraceae bacterium]|jgi:capsular exopolysaccharide synthesis family protein|nr:polysaccharide biosynthesis tyrosine autokinase [Oscillospiraceae bacterium]